MPRRRPENRTIEVILLQQDKYLGEKYEIVNVKPIFARNVLLPKNIAVLATAAMRNKYEQKMLAATKEREKKASNLDELFNKIQQDNGIMITRKVSKEGSLYAKVDEHDVAKAIKEAYKIDVESHYLKLKKKITSVGEFIIPFQYKNVKKEVLLKVVAENPEDIKKEAPKKEVEEEKTEENSTKEEKKDEEKKGEEKTTEK